MRYGVALLSIALVAAGCGASGGDADRSNSSARRGYTLRQVKEVFATHGIQLEKVDAGGHGLVVLSEEIQTPAVGYQLVNRDSRHGGYAVVYLVFVGDGPHSARRGNVFVTYGDGQGGTVKAALRQLR